MSSLTFPRLRLAWTDARLCVGSDQPYAVKTMKARLPHVLEDRIRELDNGEAFSFSVTMDTTAVEEKEDSLWGEGGALSLMHMVSCLSVQTTASYPMSLIFSHPV